jgi:hypothetical protein
MPDEQVPDAGTQQPPEAVTPPAPANGASGQPTTPTAGASGGEPGKTVELRHSDFKKIKDEAKEKGRREALSDLDAAAVEAGFTSAADALRALGQLKKTPPAQPTNQQPPQEASTMTQQPPPKTPKPPTVDKAAMENAKIADERMKMRKQWRREEKVRRQVEREKANLEAEIALRGELYQMGVRDVDYALELLRREMRAVSTRVSAAGGNPEAELAKFDRKSFMDGVRKDRPYLFGETVTPATTGTNGTTPAAGTPAPPPAGQPTVDNAQEQRFDASKATPEQVRARLQKLGLDMHM